MPMTWKERRPGLTLQDIRYGAGKRPWSLAAFEKSFWKRVNKTDTCWLWTGGKCSNGYGMVHRAHKVLRAHRVAYVLSGGTIPEETELDHLCRVILCVNPGHLEPVVSKINVWRGIGPSAKNAMKTHCIRGHAFSSENVFRTRQVTKTGRAAIRRQCRECHRMRTARYRSKAKK